jgi:hypothetical protein
MQLKMDRQLQKNAQRDRDEGDLKYYEDEISRLQKLLPHEQTKEHIQMHEIPRLQKEIKEKEIEAPPILQRFEQVHFTVSHYLFSTDIFCQTGPTSPRTIAARTKRARRPEVDSVGRESIMGSHRRRQQATRHPEGTADRRYEFPVIGRR